MKRWFTGWNDYWFIASLHLEETPAILVFLEWIMDWLCHFIYYVPKIGDLFHIYVHDPIYAFIWRHTKNTWIHLPYRFMQETFIEDYKSFERVTTWDDEESKKVIYENERYMENLNRKFMELYELLEKIGPKKYKRRK